MPKQISDEICMTRLCWRSLLAAWLLAFSGGFCSEGQTAFFDFDTGTPAPAVNQGLPLDQTAGGVTAHFVAASGNFTVQTAYFIGYPVSSFSNQFLYPAGSKGAVLEIRFSELLTNISFSFATIQISAISGMETPIQLVAYTNSAATPPVGSVSAAGIYGGGPDPTDPWPQGIISFSSPVRFNLVRISVPTLVPAPALGQATDFLIDNLTVQRAGGASCLISSSAAPIGSGTVAGTGSYSAGLTASLTATPALGYVFNNWSQNGAVISAANPYSLSAMTNRNLTANFASANYTVKSGASPFAGGASSLGASGSYPAGTNLTAIATAKAGYQFVNWLQGATSATAANVAGTSTNLTFTVNSNCTLIAVFSPEKTVSLTASPAGCGATSGAGVYTAGSTVTVLASASPGYKFVNWQQGGAVVSTACNYSFAVNSSVSLVANFQPVSSPSPVVVLLTNLIQTYDGTGRSVLAVTTPANLAVALTYQGGTPPTNAGSYTVVGTIQDTNYPGSVTNTLVVNPAPVTLIASSQMRGYLDYNPPLTATIIGLAAHGDGLNYSISTPASFYSPAGTYPIVVSGGSNPNYSVTVSNSVLVVVPAPATVSLTNLSQTYDGTGKAAVAIATPANIGIALTYNGSANAPTNVGVYGVVATVVDSNYVGSVTNTLVLSPASLPAIWAYQAGAIQPGDATVLSLADGLASIHGLACDGTNLYVNTGGGAVSVYALTGSLVSRHAVDNLSMLGDQMACTKGYVFARKDSFLYRISTADWSSAPVTVDAGYPLLNCNGWVSGSLFDTPAGQLGVMGDPGDGSLTARLYSVSSDGLTLTWDRDCTLEGIWTPDERGTASDGTFLYRISGDMGYKTYSLSSGSESYDGSSWILRTLNSGDGIINPTFITRNPVTGQYIIGDFQQSRVLVSAPACWVSFVPAASLTYDGGGQAFVASVPGAGSFSYSYQGTAATSYGPSSIPPAASGSYTVTATSTSPNYCGSLTNAFTILPATPVITTPPLAAVLSLGQCLAACRLSGGAATVPGSFVFSSPQTIPPEGSDIQTVVFLPADSLNYTTASTAVTVTVSSSPPVAPPLLMDAASVNNQIFSFTFSNSPAASFTVWTTTDLLSAPASWTVAGTPSYQGGGVFRFSTPVATNEVRRYYRVSSP